MIKPKSDHRSCEDTGAQLFGYYAKFKAALEGEDGVHVVERGIEDVRYVDQGVLNEELYERACARHIVKTG